jgi:hypothetical protein
MALYGPIYRTLLKMSRSNEFKEQGFACRCCVTDSQIGDLAASVPSPVELVSLVFACPLPRCEIERNAGSCRADPTRSARWPARVNLAAFWQQIAPIVPFLPTLPTAKYFTVCYLQIAAHLDTEEVAGSNPVVPTIFIVHLERLGGSFQPWIQSENSQSFLCTARHTDGECIGVESPF